MHILTRKPTMLALVTVVAGLGWTAGALAAVASEGQAVCPPVTTLECVQVPVTYMQTQYRTECRTETVPVTRMVPEVVNETRTVTNYECKPEMVNRQVTRYVCEPKTMV